MKNSMTFAPGGDTKNFTASNASSGIAIDQNASSFRIHNSGSVTVFITWGRTAATADASKHMPIPAGDVETFHKGSNDFIAGITASGTATLYITPGEGF